MNPRLLALPALVLPLAAGCSADPVQFWRARPELLAKGPAANQVVFPLANRIAFIDKTSATAFILDPADASLTARRVTVGKGPIAAEKHQTSDRLLVLSQGGTGTADDLPAAAQLDLIDGDPAVPVERHVLASRFDSLAQSADGRFVVLYHRADRQGQLDSTLYDPNELLIVDLAPPAGAAAPRMIGKSIRSLGSVPTDIVFSPPLGPLSGRRLAVVLAQNYVTLVDLDNPERTEISVPLCVRSTGCAIVPKQVVFDPAYLRLFVRAEGASDVFQIELRADPQALPSNDLRASASMLTVGGPPADVVLYQTAAKPAGDNTRLAVAVPGLKKLVLVDPSTTHTVTLTTSIPVTRIIPYDLSPADPSHALLVNAQAGSPSVLFATLPKAETLGSLAIEEFAIGASVREVIPLLDQGRVVLLSDTRSGSTAVTVVNLAAQSFKQIGAGGSLANVTIETRAPSRLWGVTSGTLLSYANLGDAVGTGEVSVDQAIVSIDPLAAPSADGHRYLVLGHDDPQTLGNVTFLDADTPDRTTARTAYGFLLTDYLEGEQP